MSAIIGQDWRPKTARELFIQWQAYQLDRWQHTAAIRICLSASKHAKYEDFHPYINPQVIPNRSTTSNSQSGPLPTASIFTRPNN